MKNSRLPALPRRLLAAPLLAVLTMLMSPGAAPARPELCEGAALRAAAESGVPADVLMAIALVESGRAVDGRMRPWPWAANADGRGHWFASAEEAAGFARGQLARGRPSFDLGCFQINWRWHGQHFDRPEALLDPLVSARYAARFLSQLFAEFGNWEAAAGAYHSRSPHLARAYRARFARHRATLAHLAPRGVHRRAHGAERRPDPQGTGARPALTRGHDAQRMPGIGGVSPQPERRRASVALAILQPGEASSDPASLMPQSTTAPGFLASRHAAPPIAEGLSDAASRTHAPAAPVNRPQEAGIAATAAQMPTASPAFIPALAGSAP